MHELALAQNIIELAGGTGSKSPVQQGKASLAGDWRYGLC
ncbi:Uncharacterised protein [Salmonella enterica subsp. salamae]|uniref:Uncharacterized protein n=1 Tax=Salmonella enterica subsp. salamae TaxID=59202 RepID=A0A6D2G8I9_SALER|nr:Uncharacterised protein [Salmonella enterica subsp. salamae]